jgi:hypothetical protein
VALIDAEEGRRTVAAGQFCAATLVRPDALVTAAHCVEDEEGYAAEPDELRIFAGKVLPLRKGLLRRVERIDVNPRFDDGAGQANADIAVIRLSTPLRGVPRVRLPTPRDGGIWHAGASLTLFGWGNRAAGEGQNFPRQLHRARSSATRTRAATTSTGASSTRPASSARAARTARWTPARATRAVR